MQFWGSQKDSQQAKLHPRVEICVCTKEQIFWDLDWGEAADVWSVNERENNLSFQRYRYWLSCTLCWWREMSHCTLTKLYKLNCFPQYHQWWGIKTYWSILCLLWVLFESTNMAFVHVEGISTLSWPSNKLSINQILSTARFSLCDPNL